MQVVVKPKSGLVVYFQVMQSNLEEQEVGDGVSNRRVGQFATQTIELYEVIQLF